MGIAADELNYSKILLIVALEMKIPEKATSGSCWPPPPQRKNPVYDFTTTCKDKKIKEKYFPATVVRNLKTDRTEDLRKYFESLKISLDKISFRTALVT
jgi:hypothetical protein